MKTLLMMQRIQWLNNNREWLFSGAGVAFFAYLFKVIFGWVQTKRLRLSYTYTRAFGVRQVPMFIRAMITEYPMQAIALLHAEDKEHFWAQWPHKHCKVIATSAYRELFDDGMFAILGEKILEKISLENPVSADFYRTEIDYDQVDEMQPGTEWWVMSPFRKYEFFRKFVPGKYSTEEVSKAIEKASSEVGFLMLFIKNNGDQTLTDLKVLYNDFQHPDPFNLAAVKDELNTAERKEMIIRRIDPNEELMFLLEVYRKDDKGYPTSYYSSLNIPFEIRTVHGFTRQKIRKPNRDKAAKISFPFGWTGQ